MEISRTVTPLEAADWTGRALAVLDVVQADGSRRQVEAGCSYEFQPAGHSLADARAAAAKLVATPWSGGWGAPPVHPTAAVLQARDGSYWVTALLTHGPGPLLPVSIDADGSTGSGTAAGVTPLVPALKAIIGPRTSYEFD